MHADVLGSRQWRCGALQVISDLLKPERHNLTIKEDKKRGVFVDGLSEWVVRSPQEVRHPVYLNLCMRSRHFDRYCTDASPMAAQGIEHVSSQSANKRID